MTHIEQARKDLVIRAKYNLGDVVQLMSGRIRKIRFITIRVSEYGHHIEYQGAWYTPIFSESKVAQRLNKIV